MNVDITIGEYIGESIYVYEFVPFSLRAYRAFWNEENIDLKVQADYNWISQPEIGNYDFVRSYLPFVDKIRKGEIEL